ncbi:MAG: hypothetical protein PVH37_20900 [Desulfobacterales bacterium]|jgi:hypothetical protein
MADIRRISGNWRGRLVDVQGFEGDLELNLKSGRDGRLSGMFSVEIGANHSTLRQRGTVEGKVSQKGLNLAFAVEKPPLKIKLTGDVIDLRDGGLGLRGAYDVSARNFSPLQGGVACAAKDQKVEVEIATKREWR